MGGRFIGIGVGQGDAFFLEAEDGFTALIDGGRSVVGFPSEFKRATKRHAVDVLVCTHNDADHAKGVIGFLKAGLGCNEVWLPASWTDRIGDLFLRPVEFVHELAKEVREFDEGKGRSLQNLRTEVRLLEQLDYDFNQDGPSKEQTEAIRTDLLIEQSIESDFGEELEEQNWPYLLLCYPKWEKMWLGKPWLDDWCFRLLVEGIQAAGRVRQIADLAYHRGCRIRWFEFADSVASGGIQGHLVPVNAREVASVRARKWSALHYLFLTVANRRSLVFFAPPSSGPPILFTADSDLSFKSSIAWHDGMIITAPHHGSKGNANAYSRYHCQFPPTSSSIWVRSDGQFRSRPGPPYLKLKVPRFCTLCRGSQQPKQDLQFTLIGQQWQPSGTRGCNCT